MQRKLLVRVSLGLLLVGVSVAVVSQVNALGLSTGLATRQAVGGENVLDGSIVCANPDGISACESEYQTTLYGVVVDDPAVFIDDESVEGGYFVVTSGEVMVQVTTVGGEIRKGDFITTSDKPGVGQVAYQNGYVLGIALDDYLEVNTETVGKVPVLLNVHLEAGLSSAKTNLIDALRKASTSPIFEPLDSLRYLLAALLVVVSFSLGFLYFGRMASKSVEAIGRNPLAKRSIQMTVVFHLIVTTVVIVVGMFSAYLVLIL